MAEQAHSPGPWSFEAICLDRRIAIQGGKTVYGRPYNIALVNRPGSARAGQDKANARLIAAAPELFAFGRDLMEAAEEFENDVASSRQNNVRLLNAIELFRAAIAKAEGGAS